MSETISTNLFPVLIVFGSFLSLLEYFLMPFFSKKMKSLNFVSIDKHKINKPKMSKAGIFLYTFILIFLGFASWLTKNVGIIYVIVITSLFTLLGILDDITPISKYTKIFLTGIICGIALFFVESFNFNVLFDLLCMMIVANIFNVFAGLNGLEIGVSTIISLFFGFSLLMMNNVQIGYIVLAFSLILISFLMYNKYPASIFPGNAGTMAIGGFFASLCFYYDLYLILIPFLSLHIFDCFLKFFPGGLFSSSEKKPTIILKDGKLKPRKDYLSVVRLILSIKPMSEKDIVNLIWFFELLIGLIIIFPLKVII